MKQNPSILFHLMGKFLINSYLLTAVLAVGCVTFTMAGTDSPSFDPAKGFKPAQRDLTEIYLQLAECLKTYGSPIPYIRHAKAESQRVAAAFKENTGKEMATFFPAYMDDAYINKLSENWNVLAPKLGLEPMAKENGGLIADAIKGSWGTGTIIVEILNAHQKAVYESMATAQPVEFEALQTELINRLKLKATTIDMRGKDSSEVDAVGFSGGILGRTQKLFKRLDEALPAAQAEQIKSYISSLYVDTGRAADAELKAGLLERALKNHE